MAQPIRAEFLDRSGPMRVTHSGNEADCGGQGWVGESPVYFRPNNQCDINLAIKIVTALIDQTDDAQNMIDNL